jgi:hypothetical protein
LAAQRTSASRGDRDGRAGASFVLAFFFVFGLTGGDGPIAEPPLFAVAGAASARMPSTANNAGLVVARPSLPNSNRARPYDSERK